MRAEGGALSPTQGREQTQPTTVLMCAPNTPPTRGPQPQNTPAPGAVLGMSLGGPCPADHGRTGRAELSAGLAWGQPHKLPRQHRVAGPASHRGLRNSETYLQIFFSSFIFSGFSWGSPEVVRSSTNSESLWSIYKNIHGGAAQGWPRTSQFSVLLSAAPRAGGGTLRMGSSGPAHAGRPPGS